MKKTLTIFALFFTLSISTKAQGNVDSLKLAILNQKIDNIEYNLGKASRSHTISTLFGVVSIAAVVYPVLSDMSGKSQNKFLFIAGVAAFASFAFEQQAWGYIDGASSGKARRRTKIHQSKNSNEKDPIYR